MSDYKPTIPISVEMAWELTDILNWMEMQPMMTDDQKWKIAGMMDEFWSGLDDLYREREDQSVYFKAIVDDMVDDISAMLEHQYNVRDLVELNEKQLEESFWETIRGGYLRDVEPDKLVCLENRRGKTPRVRLVDDNWGDESRCQPRITEGVHAFFAENDENNCMIAVGVVDGKYASMTEQQVQELLKEWGSME